MNKPSKCKNCQWYGKPYWSIINPCDNCPNENTNVEIFTRWQDPTINELQKQLDKYKNVIDKIKEYAEELRFFDNESVEFEISTKLLELLEEVE